MAPEPREQRGDRPLIDCPLFLITGAALMGALPIMYDDPLLNLRAAAQLGVALYFFLRHSPLFGPSLFMLLLSATFLIPFPISLWAFNLSAAAAVYFAALLLWTYRLRGEGGLWAIRGVTAQGGTPPGVGPVAGSLPRFSSPLLLAAGIIGFSLLNGTMEEIMFRGVYADGLSFLFRKPVPVVLVQALFFGLCHYRGIPSGVAGMGLSFLYGAVMGLLRLRTGGLLH